MLSVLEILIGLQVWQLDILPFKYFLLIATALILLDLLIARLLLSHNKKNIVLQRALGYFLSVLIVVVFFIASQGLSKIQETMDAVTKVSKVSAVFELYVSKDDSAVSLDDMADYRIAVTESIDQENTQLTLEAMENSTGKAVQRINYDTMFAMVDALYADEVDALLINSAYVDILTEMEAYTDFSERVKCIWEYDIHQIIEEEETEIIAEDPVTEEDSEDAPFVVYISGSDTRSKKLKVSRSDVNILAVVNPLSKQVLLINTPRDYYVENPAAKSDLEKEEKLDKLTHCGVYGIKNSMRTLSRLYNTNIEYYVRINFSGFKKMIDALGGVTVYSDFAFTAIERTPIAEGENHLNGQQALDFARERKTVPGGDADRGRHQMKVITAVIEKATTGTTIISNYSDIMDSVEGMFTMNVPAELIGELMKMQLSDMARWNIVSYSVTGSGKQAETYSMPGIELYVTEPNRNSIQKAIRLIDMVFAGERLTEEVINSIR